MNDNTHRLLRVRVRNETYEELYRLAEQESRRTGATVTVSALTREAFALLIAEKAEKRQGDQ